MKLNETIKIKGMELHNRLVMPPMCTYKSDDSGLVNDAVIDFYKERAEGGCIGLIITEHFFVSMQGRAGVGQVSIADDSVIPNMKKLTDVIHANGSMAICQINHAGSATNETETGMPIVSASEVACPGRKKELCSDVLPKALSIEEIQKIQEDFVNAAIRAKKAGYDGVEIHSAHGYMLNQFYSPLTNLRHDAYGCDSVENRTRFQVEILKKVRAALGEDYPVFIRLGGCDYMEGGSTIDDAVEACKIFEAAGADALDLSGGMCRFTRSDVSEPGYFADMTKAVKESVSIPVILTGGVKTADQAEALLQNEAGDMIGVGRMLLADAKWAVKEMKHGV